MIETTFHPLRRSSRYRDEDGLPVAVVERIAHVAIKLYSLDLDDTTWIHDLSFIADDKRIILEDHFRLDDCHDQILPHVLINYTVRDVLVENTFQQGKTTIK